MLDSLKFFSQQDLFDFIKKYNVECTKPTLARLNTNGCTILPNRHLTTGSRSSSRVYYHPFVAVEIVVITLMLRGAFLKIDNDVRTPRFTLDDVFWARTNFYLRHHASLAEILEGFNFTIPEQCSLEGNGKTLAMEKESWNYVISNRFPQAVQKNYGPSPHGFTENYLNYITDIYQMSFIAVLNEKKYDFESLGVPVDDLFSYGY